MYKFHVTIQSVFGSGCATFEDRIIVRFLDVRAAVEKKHKLMSYYWWKPMPLNCAFRKGGSLLSLKSCAAPQWKDFTVHREQKAIGSVGFLKPFKKYLLLQ